MTSGELPQVLHFEAALRSNDLTVLTVAKILELLCALVRVDGASFSPVNDRLEKYAVEPIVAKINQPRPIDTDRALREYRDRWAKHDPFAPSRVASSDVTVLSSQDVGGEAFRRSRCAADVLAKLLVFPVAEMYLRAGEKIAAAITFFRDPSAPELGLSDIWMLRDLQGLCEHTYRLAIRTEGQGTSMLDTSRLTPPTAGQDT